MQYYKYLFSTIFIFTALAVGVVADEANTQDTSCDLREPLAQLALLKEESAGTTPKTELALRKDILATTMECTAKEAERIIKSLNTLEPSSDEAKKLQETYITKLEEVVLLAETRAQSAQKLTSISGSKKAALGAKKWRDAEYLPLAWEAAQLVVLEKNTKVLTGAEDRLKQLNRHAGSLLNVEGNEAIQRNLDEAKERIGKAREATEATYPLLGKSPRSGHEPITENISSSLDNLDAAYDLFLDARKRMQRFFPSL